mgnify:CR=1 FL=1
MVQIIKYFCDTCKKECLTNEGLSTFAGFVIKMNEKLESQQLGFKGEYCGQCSETILEFIKKLKDAEDTSKS